MTDHEGFAGAWIVTGYEYSPTPQALFGNELEARMWADMRGYDYVDFWPFGTEWDQRWRNGVSDNE